MSLYQELEATHSTVKHFGVGGLDPNDLRSLLRRAQVLTTVFDSHEAISFIRGEDGWDVTMVATIDRDTKASLMCILEDL